MTGSERIYARVFQEKEEKSRIKRGGATHSKGRKQKKKETGKRMHISKKAAAALVLLLLAGSVLFGTLVWWSIGERQGSGTHGPGFGNKSGDKTEEIRRSEILICLDPGHGGIDPGTEGVRSDGSRLYEKDLTLSMAQKTAARLEARGYSLLLTRTGDVRTVPGTSTDEVNARRTLAEERGAALTVSLHGNAYCGEGRAYGARVYYNPESPVAAACAEVFAEEISRHTECMTGRAARAVADPTYAILANPDMPALLIEMGFMTDPQELSLMAGETWRNAFAEALAEATDRWIRMS